MGAAHHICVSSHSAAYATLVDVGDSMASLQDEQPKSRPPSADGAAASAAATPATFEQLFCGAFAVLDRQWLARQATYMDFPTVMK